MKTKLFTVVFDSVIEADRVDIDDKINNFLEEKDVDVIDIKFSASVSNTKHIAQALMLYNEKAKQPKKTKKSEKSE